MKIAAPSLKKISEEPAKYVLSRGQWSETITADQLLGRLKLYQDLAERKNGAHRDVYQPMVAVLRDAIRSENSASAEVARRS